MKNIFKILCAAAAFAFAFQAAGAENALLEKFEGRLRAAEYSQNQKSPQWLGDIVEAASLALELAKTQNNYEAACGVGEFLADVNDYKNAMVFLELAAANGVADAWLALAVMHFEGAGVPKDFEKGSKCLEAAEALITAGGVGLKCQSLRGYYFPIKYEIKRLPTPEGILKNFEDCGFTFSVKNSKEYLFMRETESEFGVKDTRMPVALSEAELERAKGRPFLVPEAYVVRLFSDYKENGSDVAQLVDVEIIKKKMKVLYRAPGKSELSFEAEENKEWRREYYYRFLGELSNGLQVLTCVYEHGGFWPALRFVAFGAKKGQGGEIKIDIAYIDTPPDRPYGSHFYVENDTVVEVKYDNSIAFYTHLSEEEFRKTKLQALLKDIEAFRRGHPPIRVRPTQLVDENP